MAGVFAVLYGTAAGLVALSVVTLILRDGFRSPFLRAFIFFSAGLLVWNAAYAIIMLSRHEEFVRIVYRLSSLAWGADPSLALYYAYGLSCVYLKRPSSRRTLLFIFLPTPFIWYGIFSGKLLAVDFRWTENGWIEYLDPASPWNYVFIVFLVAFMSAFLVIGLRLIRRAGTNRARLQGKMITFPITVLIVLLFFLHIFLPLLGKQTVPPLVQLLLALWTVVIALVHNHYPVLTLSPRMASEVIVERMSDICCFLDDAGIVVAANPSVRDLLGWERDLVLGRPAAELFNAEVCKAIDEVSRSARAKLPFEAELRTSEGDPLPCLITLNPVKDTLGDTVGQVLIAREIREEKRLKRLSETDSLTGVYNRRKMEELLASALSEPRRRRRFFAAIMLDIDRFKKVNDNFGHDAGDRVLVDLCDIVGSSIRDDDALGRWGGEEFLILCRNANASEAAELADRIRKRIASHKFSHGEGLTASFGVSLARAGDTAAAFVKRADTALYRSKAAGRNRVSVQEEGEA